MRCCALVETDSHINSTINSKDIPIEQVDWSVIPAGVCRHLMLNSDWAGHNQSFSTFSGTGDKQTFHDNKKCFKDVWHVRLPGEYQLF